MVKMAIICGFRQSQCNNKITRLQFQRSALQMTSSCMQNNKNNAITNLLLLIIVILVSNQEASKLIEATNDNSIESFIRTFQEKNAILANQTNSLLTRHKRWSIIESFKSSLSTQQESNSIKEVKNMQNNDEDDDLLNNSNKDDEINPKYGLKLRNKRRNSERK